MRRLTALCVVWGMGLVLAAAAAADHPGRGGTPFFATLTPEAECNAAGVCGLGQKDPRAAGETSLRLNSGQEEVCFKTAATGLAHPVIGAHIHEAPAGVAGPIVVPLSPSVGDGCVHADRELIKEIRKNPENFYVNVHTTEFRGGAIRGQLCGPGRGNC